MLVIILLVLALVVVQAGLLAQFRIALVGWTRLLGPRDNLPEQDSPLLERSKRALANLQETLPVFLTLAVLSIVFGEQGALSLWGAAIYFVARVLYVPCYLLGLSPWRSVIFSVSALGLLLLALPLLPHIGQG
jgi:uncharacterized MAPEG superfamily protein